MLRFITLILLVAICFSSFAQVNPKYSNYEYYDTEDGLPQIYVSTIVQDIDGFIWIGTQDGISRFDGKEFVNFSVNSPDPHALSTPRILDFWLSADNLLHILHFNKKVDVINPRSFVVQQDIPPALTAYYDDFSISVGQKGFFHKYFAKSAHGDHMFVRREDEFLLFDSTNTKLATIFSTERAKENVVCGYDQDSEGRLWLLTNKGLEVSDPTWENFERIDIPEKFKFQTVGSHVYPIVCQSNDRVFFMVRDRFFVYNHSKRKFTELYVPKIAGGLEHVFYNVAIDQEERVLFSYRGFVFRLETDNSVTTLWENPSRESLFIDEIFVDKMQTLWVGINTGGLYRVNLLTPSFNSRSYKRNFLVDILQDHLKVDERSIPDNWKKQGWSYELRYSTTANGEVFLTQDGYDYGLRKRIFHLKKRELIQLKLENDNDSYIRGIDMFAGDLFAVDNKANFFQWEKPDDLPNTSKLDIEITKYPKILDMVADSTSAWIIQTPNELFEVKDGQVVNTYYPGSSDSPFITIHMQNSNPDILWIGTYGNGLLKWNKLNRKVDTILTETEGLADNIVAGIVGDATGNMWLSTFNGICKFDPQTYTFVNYNKREGLIESEFNRHHEFLLPDGQIALGGTEGYSVFDPTEFRVDEYNPSVKISKFFINSKQVSCISDSSLLAKPINVVNEINLNYNQNSIAFEMAAMQYLNPEKNQYRYQLKGFNDSWVNTGTDRNVRFDNLPHGDYTLLLNASNTNKVWSSEVFNLSIRVYPPPWLSWWAYLGYFVIIAFLIFQYWQSYRKRIIRKQDEEFNRRETERLKELDTIKTRFFSNITHEFRTPLTLILSPLEKHMNSSAHSEKAREIMQANYRNGTKLLGLVNQLLDISKLESGHTQIHRSVGEPANFIKEMVYSFRELAESKGLDLFYFEYDVAGYYKFEKTQWEKIIQNLLNNAIKFTDQGNITVRINKKDQGVEIAVSDTGTGIPKNKIPLLFDRFYQVDDSETRRKEGTGIGLALVKELIDLINGTIEVSSEIGQGSIFTIYLPLEEINPKDIPLLTANDKSISKELNGKAEEKVLLVEDNSELLSFLVKNLGEMWNVLQAVDGQKAWELAQRELPDIIVSDVMIPEIDGLELCKKVKSDEVTSHIGFIMLTARAAQEAVVSGLKAGADEYVTKPFHLDELALRIQNLILQQQKIREHVLEEVFPKQPSENPAEVENSFIIRLRAYLDEHITDRELNVQHLAEAMAMSKATLNRKVRAELDVSVSEFIKRHRLQCAVNYLKAGEPIAETAYRVGFESPSYFSYVFKEVYQMSPSEYQKGLV